MIALVGRVYNCIRGCVIGHLFGGLGPRDEYERIGTFPLSLIGFFFFIMIYVVFKINFIKSGILGYVWLLR